MLHCSFQIDMQHGLQRIELTVQEYTLAIKTLYKTLNVLFAD